LEFTPLARHGARGCVPQINPFAKAQREAKPEQPAELI